MKKVFVSWQEVERHTQEILRQIQQDMWVPDYVVGLTRGGLVPANLISQYLDIPMETLKVSLRDDNSQPESNLWMAADAFGDNLDSEEDTNVWVETYPGGNYSTGRKNILIVDDINDSGATLNWIKQDWQASCLPEDERWLDDIWGKNVRVAVLYDNEASKSELDIAYSSVTINKAEEDQWIVFPWEDWWK
jgi:hypoxanthine phosphoribosyltransferase